MVGLSGILAIIYFFLGIAGAIFFIANHEMMLGLCVLLFCFTFAAILMLLITIISEIENLKSHIYRNVSGGHPPTGNISNAGSHLSSEDADVTSFWTCNSCGAENANKKIYCDNCGKHK